MVYKFDEVPWALKTIWFFEELPGQIQDQLNEVNKAKFDAVIMPLFNHNAQRIGDITDFIKYSTIKSDLELKQGQSEKLHIQLSNLDITCQDEKNRHFNRTCLKQEIAYAAYLGVASVILKVKIVKESDIQKYASFIQKIKKLHYFPANKICIDIDINQWTQYNLLRLATKMNLPVILTLNEELPNKNDQRRWLAENVKFIHIPHSIFRMNDQGEPILKDLHNQFLTSCFQYEPYIAIQGLNPGYDLRRHRTFLIHLFRNQKPLSDQAFAAADYFDSLQVPLQPYKENLDALTYETFEQDQIKYELYEQGISKFLQQWSQKNQGKELQILMAGAGRGGILNRVIKQVNSSQIKTNVVALEKNPYAYMSLLYLQRQNPEWKKIKIVLGDLKTWDYQGQFDLVVSELLGSFGDNELSPECLKWAQQFMHKDSVSIPKNSISYIAPITCPLLYNSVINEYGEKGLQSYYVVHLQKYYAINNFQQVFEFKHPDFEGFNKLSQEKVIEFEFKQELLLHGFSAYFTSELYENISMSILPKTWTNDMYSWFPIFFPLIKPIHIEKNSKLQVTFKRINNDESVWYEWVVKYKDIEQLHNNLGQFQSIKIK